MVLCYTPASFVNTPEMLRNLLSRSKDLLKDDGYLLVMDFHFYEHDDWSWSTQRLIAPTKEGVR